jgi:hypothetical protein
LKNIHPSFTIVIFNDAALTVAVTLRRTEILLLLVFVYSELKLSYVFTFSFMFSTVYVLFLKKYVNYF